jgi:hypothetical protein
MWSSSGYSQAIERCTSHPTSNIRSDGQFKHADIRKFYAVFFDFGCGMGRAEILLLAHDLSQRAFPVRGPSQHKLLGATRFTFLKYERDEFVFLWPIKN